MLPLKDLVLSCQYSCCKEVGVLWVVLSTVESDLEMIWLISNPYCHAGDDACCDSKIYQYFQNFYSI